MSTDAAEAPAKEFSAETKELGDKIASLTLKDAKDLSDYLKDAYGIEPASGGGVVMAAAPAGDGDGGGAAAAQTEFDVIMETFGDNKIAVIKELRAITGLGLKEAKALAEEKGGKVKEKVSAEEAEDVKKKLEAVGASVSVK